MRQLSLYSLLVLICGMALGISSVYAQAFPAISPSGIELSVSSTNPAPGQPLTITARSFTDNIQGSTVIWTVNGAEIKRGTGATTLSIQAPELGKKLTVGITAITPEGRRYTSSIVIGSGSIDLIVESDGYVPPLFSGKIHPMFQNEVKVIAIPHLASINGQEYDPEDLIYRWHKDSRVIETQSGYGKQSILIEGSLVPRPYTVMVEVQTRDSAARAQSLITINPGQPFLGLYIDDPLYGPLYNKAVSAITNLGTQRETGVIAVPFGFNGIEDVAPKLSYSWKINGASRPELASSQSIVLRAPEGVTGRSDIQVAVRNTEDILQSAQAGFRLNWSAVVETEEEGTESGFRF